MANSSRTLCDSSINTTVSQPKLLRVQLWHGKHKNIFYFHYEFLFQAQAPESTSYLMEFHKNHKQVLYIN